MKPLVYTLNEAAALLQVSPKTIRRLILRKKLPRVAGIWGIRIPAGPVHQLAEGNDAKRSSVE